MKTSTIFGLSAIFWIGGAIWNDQSVIAAVFAVGHVIAWQIHVIEVKLNKLLSDRGIFVAEYELRE